METKKKSTILCVETLDELFTFSTEEILSQLNKASLCKEYEGRSISLRRFPGLYIGKNVVECDSFTHKVLSAFPAINPNCLFLEIDGYRVMSKRMLELVNLDRLSHK